MSNVVVREATLAELDAAVSVQVMAFGSDPVMRWMYPGAQAYLDHFPSFAKAFGGGAFEYGTAWVTEDFGGAAMWYPPGEQVEGERLGEIISNTVRSERLDEVFAVLGEMERFHIEEDHWYLAMIGVDPSKQGRGIGSALLSHSLAKCDEASLPAYLESSNPANVPLYERHGFRVLGKVEIGDFPAFFPMLRDAR